MALFEEFDRLLRENESNLDALARALDADQAATRRMLDCAGPALFGGLAHRTRSDSGAAAVFNLVRGHDGLLLRDVAGFVDAGDPQSIGSSLVGCILGRRRNHVEQKVSATSGLGVGSVAKFLPTLAPLVVSFLGKKVAGGGLSDGGLASMLDDNLASMSAAGHDDVIASLGEAPTSVESADTGLLAGLARVADLGGLTALVGLETQAEASMPELETAAAPSKFRQAIQAADTTVADAPGSSNPQASAKPDQEAEAEAEAEEVEVEAEEEGAEVTAAEEEEAEVEEVDVDEEQAAVEVADVKVVEEEAAVEVADVKVVEEEAAVEVAADRRSGLGWLKWLFPLLALALLIWLAQTVLNGGPDEIVGNDLGGRSVTIGVETMPDGDTEGAGWDFDVWHEVCGVIDCKAEFVRAPWPGVMDQVASGEIEAAINGISITEERRDRVDFSDPYLTIEQKMLVARGNDRYTATTDVIDDRASIVGAQAGSVDYELAQRLVPEDRIKTFDGFEAVIAALIDGEIDGAIFEDASGVGYVGDRAAEVRAVDGSFGRDELGFVFPPGSDYVGPVNHAIAELTADGVFTDLARQYLVPS